MMHATRLPNSYIDNRGDILFSVLENAEVGVVVVDPSGRAIYTNSSARQLLQCQTGILPEVIQGHLQKILDQLRQATQAVERWAFDEMVLRVRARPLDRFSGMTVLEISVAKAGGTRQIAEQLSRSLRLSISDAKLLGLLWRGLSNDEIAQALNVRVGTVKSRLFRLYQKLGVKRRPAAVLRAAEVLAS